MGGLEAEKAMKAMEAMKAREARSKQGGSSTGGMGCNPIQTAGRSQTTAADTGEMSGEKPPQARGRNWKIETVVAPSVAELAACETAMSVERDAEEQNSKCLYPHSVYSPAQSRSSESVEHLRAHKSRRLKSSVDTLLTRTAVSAALDFGCVRSPVHEPTRPRPPATTRQAPRFPDRGTEEKEGRSGWWMVHGRWKRRIPFGTNDETQGEKEAQSVHGLAEMQVLKSEAERRRSLRHESVPEEAAGRGEELIQTDGACLSQLRHCNFAWSPAIVPVARRISRSPAIFTAARYSIVSIGRILNAWRCIVSCTLVFFLLVASGPGTWWSALCGPLGLTKGGYIGTHIDSSCLLHDVWLRLKWIAVCTGVVIPVRVTYRRNSSRYDSLVWKVACTVLAIPVRVTCRRCSSSSARLVVVVSCTVLAIPVRVTCRRWSSRCVGLVWIATCTVLATPVKVACRQGSSRADVCVSVWIAIGRFCGRCRIVALRARSRNCVLGARGRSVHRAGFRYEARNLSRMSKFEDARILAEACGGSALPICHFPDAICLGKGKDPQDGHRIVQKIHGMDQHI